MAKEFAKAFYHSRQWKKCRDSYIRQRIGIDGGLCELCQSSLGYIVHHKDFKTVPKILETPYIPSTENPKKSFAPYKHEIEMLKTKTFSSIL